MRPVNDDEVLEALDQCMRGYGNGERAARELGVESAHLRSMRSGHQAISLKVAKGLGFQLRWVKKEK
jgi:hypothetical protein